MSGKRTERVHGPYKHGNRWRVVLVDASGNRTLARESEDGPTGFATQAAADAYCESFRAETAGRTIGSAVADYLEHCRRYGNRNRPLRESSVTTNRHKLEAFFQLPVADRPLVALTAKYAARLYRDRVPLVKVDTHRGELAIANTFAKWCVQSGWLRANPFADVKPEGERSAGKATLRMDDAERYLLTCLGECSKEGLAGAALFMMGLRVSELALRKVRDLDERGTVLCIPRGAGTKNKSSVRRAKIPAELQPGIAELARGKGPDDSIFGMSRYAMYHHVQRLCKSAGVPVVCPHGLRGTGTTTAVDLGISLERIQRAVGHEVGSKITEKSYIVPGALDNARTARLSEGLDAGNRVVTDVLYELPAPRTEVDLPRKEELN